MAETYTQVPPDSTGDKLAGQSMTRGADTVLREEVVIGDPTGNTAMASVSAANGLEVDVTQVQGTVTVDGSAVTQPVSAAALPLPSGAATAAAQLADGHAVTVDNASLAVTAASLPLPAGAATAAAQLADGHSVDTELTTADLDTGAGTDTRAVVGLALAESGGAALVGSANPLPTDGSGVTQPVSAAALPLPSGAATAAAQLPDGHAVTVDNASIAVTAAALPLPSGAATAAAQLPDGHNVTVDNASVAVTAAALPLPSGAATAAAQLADGHNVTVDNASIAVTNAIGDGWDNAASDGASVSGDVAHDAADAGEPIKVGAKAVSLGADPTEVAANDRTNLYATRAGQLFTLGGHPNIVTREYMTTAAQTNDAIIDSVAATDRIVVTEIEVLADNANSVSPQVRVGFGAASVPAEPASGASTTGIVLTHPGVAAGSGVVRGSGAGIVGIGADGEELRITNSVPTGGQLTVLVSYFIISDS